MRLSRLRRGHVPARLLLFGGRQPPGPAPTANTFPSFLDLMGAGGGDLLSRQKWTVPAPARHGLYHSSPSASTHSSVPHRSSGASLATFYQRSRTGLVVGGKVWEIEGVQLFSCLGLLEQHWKGGGVSFSLRPVGCQNLCSLLSAIDLFPFILFGTLKINSLYFMFLPSVICILQYAWVCAQ